LRSSLVDKQFISSGAGVPDQLASALPMTAFFSSPHGSAPHRFACAKQRVDASLAARSRVPLRVVPTLGCPEPSRQAPRRQKPAARALRTGAALRWLERPEEQPPEALPSEPRPATDRLDRTRPIPTAASSAFSVESSLGAAPKSSRSLSRVHTAPAARRRQHRQLLKGDTTRNHRDGSWRRPLHRPTRPRDIAQLLRRASSRLTGRPPAARLRAASLCPARRGGGSSTGQGPALGRAMSGSRRENSHRRYCGRPHAPFPPPSYPHIQVALPRAGR